MSIETPGQIEALDFKTSQSVTAGFVKNKADGEFEYGQAGSAWDLIEAKEITTNLDDVGADPFTVQPRAITFSGLNGDVDEIYLLSFNGRYNDPLGSAGVGVGPAAPSFRFMRLGINGITANSLATGFRSRLHFLRGNGGHGVFFNAAQFIFSFAFRSSPEGPADFHGRLIFSGPQPPGLSLFRTLSATSSVNPVDTPGDVSPPFFNPLNLFGFHGGGTWLDAFTNITSLNIEFVGQQTVVLPDSSWYLYKIKK